MEPGRDQEKTGLTKLSILALAGGCMIGLVGGIFRFLLETADERRTALIGQAWGSGWAGFLIVAVSVAVLAAAARALVRLAPLAAGSGVQHVEAVMRGEAEAAPLRVLPVKFFGGLMAIGGGLALGREGPTVQMGATIGSTLAGWCRLKPADLRDLQAAMAGAGLAVAFNAPVAGMLFVFEEVAREFRIRLSIVALMAGGSAVAVSRLLIGDQPDFLINQQAVPGPSAALACLLMGCLLGLLGVVYNKSVIGALEITARLRAVPPEAIAAGIGLIVASVGWFAPGWIGGGDPLNQQLLTTAPPVGVLVLILGTRWFLGVASYAAGTPGGLFAPLLVLGTSSGLIFAAGANAVVPGILDPQGAALVAMVAFFTAVVRAPVTGIVLLSEMAATTDLLIPMIAAAFGATLTATLLGGPPIYDTLRERMLRPAARAIG